MPQPPAYHRNYNFGSDAPGQINQVAVNTELDGVAGSVNAIRHNLALIQRDDGGLRSHIVTTDAIADGVISDMVVTVNAHIQPQVLLAEQSASAAAASAAAAQAHAHNAEQVAQQAGSTAATAVNTANATLLEAATATTTAHAAVNTADNVNAKATQAQTDAAQALTVANTALAAAGGNSSGASFHSPVFTGAPTAPTAATGDNSTRVATTAYVNNVTTQGYAPKTHSHTIAHVTGLQAALNGKLNTSGGTLTGTLTVNGFVHSKAKENSNPALFLRDVNGNNRGNVYWDRNTDRVQLSRYHATTFIIEGWARINANNTFQTSHAIHAPGFVGNATSADKLKTARTLKIGDTGKPFDGTGNLTWTLAEMGAASVAAVSAIEAKADDALAAVMAATPLLIKTDYSQPCLFKVTATSLRVRAGTSLVVDGNLITFANDTNVSLPTLQAGCDYSVWVHPDGTAVAVKDMFASPASPPAAGARKIGGFHFGLVTSGTTVAAGDFATTGGGMIWTQTQVNDIAGINKYSIWDLHFRSAGEQHGFAFDPHTRIWAAIYFCGKFHDADGISAYSKAVASGTVLPRIPAAYRNGTTAQFYERLNPVEAAEISASHGARLPRPHEFYSMAYGTTEGQSLGGAETTIALTKREPGFTSRIGLEQVTGHQWTFGLMSASTGGGGWYTPPGGRGRARGGVNTSRFGGARVDGNVSGSRADYGCNGLADSNYWYNSLRAVCDHLQLAL